MTFVIATNLGTKLTYYTFIRLSYLYFFQKNVSAKFCKEDSLNTIHWEYGIWKGKVLIFSIKTESDKNGMT